MSKKSPQQKPKPNSFQQEPKKSLDIKNYHQGWYYLCWLIYLCYCYAAFVPTGAVWGIHFTAYIPDVLKIILLIAGGLLLVPKIQMILYRALANLFSSSKDGQKLQIIPAAIISGICFMLFHTFTIKTDIYGDNIRILKDYADNSKFDWNWIGDMFSPHLDVNKEALTVAIHRIVAHFFSISIESSYRIMSEIFGSLFIFVWLLFVQKITEEKDRSPGDDQSSSPIRIVLILLGMFAGAVQVFFGHVENYSFGILTYTLFLAGLYFYIEGKLGTVLFVLLYLLAFKAHIIAILFFPAFIVALAYRYRNTFPKLQSLFTWRTILKVVILPAFIAGLVLYFFLFHSWNEPYSYIYSKGKDFEQTFLPIVTSSAPLDHYSLWSPYHIADFFNLLLLTSAPIVVILASLAIFNRKEISWSQPRIIVFGLAAIFPFLFFFALNPNLSPVRDWDVYTLLFPPLLFFAAVLLIQPGVRWYMHSLLAQSLVFGVIFTSVLVAVNCSPDELQLRLMDAGAYTYRSYYASSKFIEKQAFAMNENSSYGLIHFSDIIREFSLAPATGNDPELADMMSSLARFQANSGNEDAAIAWLEMARKTDTTNQRYIIDLAAYNLNENRLPKASTILETFLKSTSNRENWVDTKLVDVLAKLITSYQRAGNDSLSVVWAKRAIPINERHLKIFPNDVNARANQEKFYRFAGRDSTEMQAH